MTDWAFILSLSMVWIMALEVVQASCSSPSLHTVFTVFNISVSHFLVFPALTAYFCVVFSPSSRKITILAAAYHLHPFVFTWFWSFFSSLISPPLLFFLLPLYCFSANPNLLLCFVFSLTFHLFSPEPNLALFFGAFISPDSAELKFLNCLEHNRPSLSILFC